MNQRVRFWDLVNGGYVRVTVKDGATLSHVVSHLTDEGFVYEKTTWTYDAEAAEVVSETYSRGRDCDGLHEHQSVVACPVADLEARYDTEFPVPGKGAPKWEARSESQRDHTAEAAGY